MPIYQKILIALELNNSSCDQIIVKKAESLFDPGHTRIYLIHAIEHMINYGAAYGVSAGVDIEAVLMDEAQKTLSEIGNRLNIPQEHQMIKNGPAKFVILDEAKHIGADLIIVGSHGRHGVRLLLGSTANAVLHGAQCDVLAIRVTE